MKFIYNNKEYDVNIIRKNNKNTYVRVKENSIYVTCNYFTTNHSIERLLKDNRKLIEKMIEKDNIKSKRKELFLVFGKEYNVVYGDFDKDINITDTTIEVVSDEALLKWMNNYISDIFYKHLMIWYERFEENIPEPILKIKRLKSKWGSCNTKTKVITLNLELFRYDIECLDYVIIHELSHFLEPNHSKNFWQIVAKYCPNYKEIKKKLKN